MTSRPHAHDTNDENPDRERFDLRTHVTRQFTGFNDHPTMNSLVKRADARRARGTALDDIALVDVLREARDGCDAVIEPFLASDTRGQQ